MFYAPLLKLYFWACPRYCICLGQHGLAYATQANRSTGQSDCRDAEGKGEILENLTMKGLLKDMNVIIGAHATTRSSQVINNNIAGVMA